MANRVEVEDWERSEKKKKASHGRMMIHFQNSSGIDKAAVSLSLYKSLIINRG
jgi:hypothetical protein